MYKNLYLSVTKFIILIAMIAFSFTITWQIFEIPYLTSQTINGQTIYYYDFENYLNNIQLNWDGLRDIWGDLIPWRTWISDITLNNWTNALANNIALLFDYIYMPINLICTIFRTIAFLMVKAFSILGLITTEITINGITYTPPWFITMFNFIRQKFIIPYI